MRLGLLGGTFDPIHRGHLRLATAALARGLERVDFVPARRPPHKNRADIAGAFHRFAMAALSSAGHPRLGVCPFEISRDTPSYTIETARHVADQGHEVTLIMGSDSLVEIESWRDCRELLELTRVMVYPRPPATAADLPSRLPGWVRARLEQARPTIVVMDEPAEDVSSSLIRGRLKAGLPIGGLVPGAVEEYIAKQRLYVDGVTPEEA